jgi:hypothetical protein
MIKLFLTIPAVLIPVIEESAGACKGRALVKDRGKYSQTLPLIFGYYSPWLKKANMWYLIATGYNSHIWLK